MTLKNRLNSPQKETRPLMAVGVYDALTALIAEQAGFEAAFVSGSALAYSQLARPDIGLISLTETALAVERIRDRVEMYLLVDADSGFGNAFDAARTVRTLERAGANGIQLEDQENTKRPKEVTTRPVISTQRMVGKIKSAVDARQNQDTIISARTDAVFTLGVDAALERAAACLEAGADMIFIEGLKQHDDIRALTKLCEGQAPVLYNVLDPNSISAQQLQELGVAMILYPGVIINSMANAGRNAVDSLAASLGLADQKEASYKAITEIIEANTYLEKGYQYDH